MVTKVLIVAVLVGAFGIVAPAQAAGPVADGTITISGATGSLATE